MALFAAAPAFDFEDTASVAASASEWTPHPLAGARSHEIAFSWQAAKPIE
jgi:hypothetical protein